jgi:hypothetical protein
VTIEDLGNRVHERIVFTVGGGKIQHGLTSEIGPDDAILGHADDGFFAIDGWFEGFSDVDIKPAFDFLLFRRDGLDDLAAQRDLVEGGHPLLAVE